MVKDGFRCNLQMPVNAQKGDYQRETELYGKRNWKGFGVDCLF